jgi:rod shape-determining protein MreD
MSKILKPLLVTFLLVILGSSLYPYLEIYNTSPNLILILVLIFSILRDYKKNLFWIIFGGLFLDIFSFENPLGLSIFGLLLAGYLASFLRQNIFQKISLSSISLIGVSVILVYKLFIIFSLKLISISTCFNFGQIATEIVYSLAVLIPLFYLLNHFLKNKKTAIFK